MADSDETATRPVAVALSSAASVITAFVSSEDTLPHSHRVARPSLSSVPPVSTSPPLPARSPLRPPARSLSSQSSGSQPVTSHQQPVASSNTSISTLDSPVLPQTPTDDYTSLPDTALPASTFQMRDRHNSFPSLNGLIDPFLAEMEGSKSALAVDIHSKSLPERPDSPLSIDLDDGPTEESTTDSSPRSSAPPSISHQATMVFTKRQYALQELLSSEKAYAADLALIRDVHIPLASGLTAPLHNLPITPPNSSSSGSSSRTVSTASSSDSSTASLGPPMTQEDIKIIFSNVAELAELADQFAEELALAVGSAAVEGAVLEDDYVGRMFVEKAIPRLERPYKQYITRHPTALQHLQNLPQTPALAAYLSYTQTVASSMSHAWDLASLLIKPVQRLLKYPLLLNAILEETPDGHPDKPRLREAREGIEELARNVNEGRRRAEVVKDVLTAKSVKKPSAPAVVAAGVNLSKVKSLKHGGVSAATMRVSRLTEGNSEAAQVEALQNELRRLDAFAQQFGKGVVDWGKMMSNVMLALRTWAVSFGKVIGLSSEQGSEAFDAFMEVIKKGLLPLTADLEAAINEMLLKDIARLLSTMNQPLKLLASMNEQEPYHYHLLTMPVSNKNRPPPSLLAASTNYLALRGQLAADLPVYIQHLHRGLDILVRRLAAMQTRFWRDVKEHWMELWEMLRVEGELNAGSEETCAVWRSRWKEVDDMVQALSIMQPVPKMQPTTPKIYPPQYGSPEQFFAYPGYYMPLTPAFGAPPPISPPLPKEKDRESAKEKHVSKSSKSSSGGVNPAAVASMFAALEPAHSPAHHKKQVVNVSSTVNMLASLNPAGMASSVYTPSTHPVSAPLPLGSHTKEGKRGRGRGISDASMLASSTQSQASGSGSSNGRRPSSQDSTHSRQKEGAKLSRRRTHGHELGEDFAEFIAHQHGAVLPSYEASQLRYSGPIPNSRQGITRMKSMPLAKTNSDRASLNATRRMTEHGPLPLMNGAGYIVDGDGVYYQPPVEEEWDEYQQDTIRQTERGRDRTSRPTVVSPSKGQPTSSTKPSGSSPKRKSKERPTHARKRSGSVKSITSFFTGSGGNGNGTNASASATQPTDPPPLTASQRDSWVSKPAKYICQVIHACKPPASVSYYSFPFFTLKEGDLYEVLHEAGHPSIHPNLPLYVDDGEDCLLLCRDGNSVVGWALASFLEPVSVP